MGFSDLETIMKNLLDKGKYSDLTISCEGIDFKVHRVVVCSQSSFFDAAVSSGFRVRALHYHTPQPTQNPHRSNNPAKEATLSRVDLPEDDVETITRVLTFCYVQDYNASIDPDLSKPSDLKSGAVAHNNLRVYLAADKFNIPLLKKVASERVIAWASLNWNSASFTEIVRDIWCCAPPHDAGLRDAITGIVSSHIQHLLAHPAGKNVLVDHPELTVGVLKQVADREALLKVANEKRKIWRANAGW